MARTTPLYDWHKTHGGRMVDFAGWTMPVQYESIIAEHHAVRGAAGLFDVSHMGRLRFDGPDASRLLNHLLTRDVEAMSPGAVRYALITNESAGILDDVLVYHLADAADRAYYLLVVNASNREKIVAWIDRHRHAYPETVVSDVTDDWAMVAVQGPLAIELVREELDVDVSTLRYYEACETLIAGHGGIVSRTGYTGEDGCELILGSRVVEEIVQRLLHRGAHEGVKPAGLGCRDTLRLEAGMPLYGHELDETIDPFTAGLKFAVDMASDFIGRESLERIADAEPKRVRIGLELPGKRPAREGCKVLDDHRQVGVTTSGTVSPTLNHPIAMAYVEPEFRRQGTQLSVDIRGKSHPATVTKLPFYRREVAHS